MADLQTTGRQSPQPKASTGKPNARSSRNKDGSAAKRKCVSTACIACRRRKSKCDGNIPSCAACASVYGTECVYDPNSDHRRKGVYKKGVDSSKTPDSTLRILIEGILNYPEHEVLNLVRQIRVCESLEDVAQGILSRNSQVVDDDDEDMFDPFAEPGPHDPPPRFERELSGKLGEVRLENGAIQFLGGTSNLLYVDNSESGSEAQDDTEVEVLASYSSQEDAIRSWTTVTDDTSLILHLLHMYFTWHYTYFTTLSRSLFFRDFLKGRAASPPTTKTVYCTRLLVNAMLTLGCHFTSWPGARSDPTDSATAGDHFFRECKHLIVNNEEYEHARIATVQALALMSVREAGCGREAKGWIYSGTSFRMAMDLGLPYESSNTSLSEEEIDARRMTFWGCFLFDKCWSNYLGRPPQIALENITIKKYDVFPQEDSDTWSPWTDRGLGQAHAQPSRTRAIALQISTLCEISSDLLLSFYKPNQIEKPLGRQAELKQLSDLHTRLEAWKRDLPREFEAREGQLPQVLMMHMFFHLLFIHLFRPFLKYAQGNSPLPAHVSPRRHCTSAATSISKLLRLYKKTHGLRQICNIAVYFAHSACTIHLLNIQDKDARRDLVHGLKHLEEISESWLCARRTLGIIHHQIRKWRIEIPDEAQETLDRIDVKYSIYRLKHDSHSDASSPAGGDTTHYHAHYHSAAARPLPPSTVATATRIMEDAKMPTAEKAAATMLENMPATTVNSGPSSNNPITAATVASITASNRLRSPSSAHRAELLRQMQQNSLQNQINQSAYSFPLIDGNVHEGPKWNEDIWKVNSDIHIDSAAAAAATTTTTSLHENPVPLKTQRATHQQSSIADVSSPQRSALASPTVMFASEQQIPPNLFDEQRDWWMKDQTAFFNSWLRHDNMGGDSSPHASASGVEGTNDGHLAATGMFAASSGDIALADDYSSQHQQQQPPEWPNYPALTGGNGVQGANFGFNTNIL